LAERDATTDDPRTPVGLLQGTYLGLRADVITAISAVVVSIVVSRGLGPENRGVFFLAFAAATLLALFGDLGLSAAGIVFSANREVALAELHGIAVSFALAAAAIAGSVLLGLEGFWTSNILKGLDTAIMAMLALAVAPLLYTQIMVAILTGLGRIPAVSLLRIGVAVATPLALVPAVVISGSATWSVAAYLATTVSFAAAMAVYATRSAAAPRVPRRASVRKVIAFGARGYIGTLSHHGFLRIDLFMLSARLGPATVGIYSLSSIIAERISMLGSAVYGASAAKMGSAEPREAAFLAAQIVRLLVTVLVPAAIVMGALSFPAFPLIFGEDFGDAALPFALLLPGTVSLTLWYPISLFILSTLRRPGTTTAIQVVALLFGIPLYYFAIVAWEMTGAAIASSLVYLSVLTMGVGVLVRNSDVGPGHLVPGKAEVKRLAGLGAAGLRRARA
jgi:O-antigen/teichoic acid export membrane protein